MSDNGAGGQWSASADFIQFDIGNDLECGGSSDDAQTGEAVIYFEVKEEDGLDILLSMQGAAEAQYETFEMFLDDKLIVEVTAVNSTACLVSTCNMCKVKMDEIRLHLEPGNHHINVTVDTIDNYYHNNAYFRIEFEVEKPTLCKTNDVPCSCSSSGKRFLMQFTLH